MFIRIYVFVILYLQFDTVVLRKEFKMAEYCLEAEVGKKL